jgi:integrase
VEAENKKSCSFAFCRAICSQSNVMSWGESARLKKIIEGAEGQYRFLFALLAGTGMRIGEAAGLHVADLDLDNCVIYVRRGVWNGLELSPKTRNAVREIVTLIPALLRRGGSMSGTRKLAGPSKPATALLSQATTS